MKGNGLQIPILAHVLNSVSCREFIKECAEFIKDVQNFHIFI